MLETTETPLHTECMLQTASRILALITLFLLLSIQPALAQSNDWQILLFESRINLQTDGVVSVRETIKANFKQSAKHGIFRDIPFLYQLEDGERYTEVSIKSVLRNGRSESFELSRSDSHIRLKIGDGNKAITGSQDYVIHYLVSGIISEYDKYDEIYWNVTGNDWEVGIQTAKAYVTLPTETDIQTACYQGYSGSTEKCTMATLSNFQTGFTSTRPLASGEGMTIAAGFQKGAVSILTPHKPKTAVEQLASELAQPYYWVAGVVAILGGITVPFLWWWRRGRDWWWQLPGQLVSNQTARLIPWGHKPQVVVEFEPPFSLRPAQMGALLDQRADTLDVTSTIIDLASRGYLTIKELAKSWAFGSNDYELHLTSKSHAELLPYEKLLIKKLFEDGQSVKLSSLKNSFYQDLAAIKQAVYKDLMSKKYFVAHPETIRNMTVGVGVGSMLAGGGIGYASYALVWAWLLPLALLVVAAGIGLLLTSIAMPQRTAEGFEAYRRTLGYRLFISTAERYRQQFFERQNTFTEILPYAMMFGLTDKFAKAMEQIGYVPTQPSWYYGVHAFNLSQFSNDIISVSKALSSTMASAPQSSGSGGGGSSGGGFGGGGGGSW